VANLRDIKRRINSVVSIQQITRTMEMVATAKIRRATERIVAATPYASAMAEVLQSVARQTKNPKNPLLLRHAEIKRIIVVVIASDRGMAGGFNSAILRTAENFIMEMHERGVECEIIACGSKTNSYFRERNTPTALNLRGNSADPTIVDAQRIASYVIDSYTNKTCDQVVMFYNHARNVADQELRLEQILPITSLDTGFQFGEEWDSMFYDEGAKAIASRAMEKQAAVSGQARMVYDEDEIRMNYEYEPSAAVVLNALLPDYVKTRIYHALLDSAAGEQGARRKAMKAATDNANEMIETLMRQYNRARQSAITTEITEIVGGAAALEDND